MKKEYKRIRKLSKKIIGKTSFKKVKKVKNYQERTEGLKYLVASKLDIKLQDLEAKIKGVNRDINPTLDFKIKRLKHKINIFKTTHKKRDYLVLQELTKEIEDQLKNV